MPSSEIRCSGRRLFWWGPGEKSGQYKVGGQESLGRLLWPSCEGGDAHRRMETQLFVAVRETEQNDAAGLYHSPRRCATYETLRLLLADREKLPEEGTQSSETPLLLTAICP